MSIPPLIYVALGGAAGASLRYFFMLYIPFPILLVNVIGSFIIGITFAKLSPDHPTYIPFINIGLLGGFTTFSTFSLELFDLMNSGLILRVFIYAIFTVSACLLACFIGTKVGSSI